MKCTAGGLARAIVIVATLGAAPAFSQDGGVSQLALTSFTGPSSINFGGTGMYTVVITNNGPNNATGVQMAATLPTLPTPPTPPIARLTFTATSANCTKISTSPSDPPLPCRLPDIDEFASITATFTVQLSLPSKPYTFPCPMPITLVGNTTVTVRAANDQTNPDAGVSGSTNSSNAVRPFADIMATLTGPASANEGDTVQYQAAVTNLGPCPANDVAVTSGAAGDITFVSNSGDCASSFPCALGIMSPGTSKTFTSMYTIEKLPDPLKSTGDPNSITATSAVTPLPDGGTLRPATFDPDTSNNTARTQTVVTSSGCRLAGGPAPMGLAVLVLLLGFAIGRRARG